MQVLINRVWGLDEVEAGSEHEGEVNVAAGRSTVYTVASVRGRVVL
jgi:hypothetical protein